MSRHFSFRIYKVLYTFGFPSKKCIVIKQKIFQLQPSNVERFRRASRMFAHVAPVKTINTQYGSTLKKQELVVRDTSGSIKLILWQEYVESQQESKTYRLQNVRVKISKDETYIINTAKSEQFVFEEVEAFDGDLPPVDADMVGMATSKVHGKIVGVLNISKTLACISCFKTVTSKNEKIGNCESCK